MHPILSTGGSFTDQASEAPHRLRKGDESHTDLEVELYGRSENWARGTHHRLSTKGTSQSERDHMVPWVTLR